MTVHLRDNIFWSDGVQFNADDLVYTVQTILGNPKPGCLLLGAESVGL